MVFGVKHGVSAWAWAWVLACTLLVAPPTHAADVGGWFADQQKASAQTAVGPDANTCAQVIARAASDATAIGAYHAGLCYLQSDRPDLLAAKAWLSRAAEMSFLPAHRLLRSIQMAEAGLHSPTPHCHDLGQGRQICHGGAAAQPVAAATTN